jgi:hypothetical protein
VTCIHLLTEINAPWLGFEMLATRAPTIELPWVREARFANARFTAFVKGVRYGGCP